MPNTLVDYFCSDRKIRDLVRLSLIMERRRHPFLLLIGLLLVCLSVLLFVNWGSPLPHCFSSIDRVAH